MAVVAKDAIRVEGLKEFLARMQQVQAEAPRTVVKAALNKAAGLVVVDARRRAPVRTGSLRASIVATSTVSFARVSEGNARVPYAGFIDYGNKVHSGHGVGRKDSVPRAFMRTGRILYPAFSAQRANVVVGMNTALREAMQSVGIGVDE